MDRINNKSGSTQSKEHKGLANYASCVTSKNRLEYKIEGLDLHFHMWKDSDKRDGLMNTETGRNRYVLFMVWDLSKEHIGGVLFAE